MTGKYIYINMIIYIYITHIYQSFVFYVFELLNFEYIKDDKINGTKNLSPSFYARAVKYVRQRVGANYLGFFFVF